MGSTLYSQNVGRSGKECEQSNSLYELLQRLMPNVFWYSESSGYLVIVRLQMKH